MNEELGIPHRPPASSDDEGGWVAFRIPNSEFRIRNCFIAAAAFLVALSPGLASAKLAVFVDGRVLKVADARLVGDEIVLDLKGGGTLSVPAIRIDRVIADEVEDTSGTNGLGERDCPSSWTEEPLPPETPFGRSISAAARATDLHPWLVAAVVQTESAFDPRAVSRVGASGSSTMENPTPACCWGT